MPDNATLARQDGESDEAYAARVQAAMPADFTVPTRNPGESADDYEARVKTACMTWESNKSTGSGTNGQASTSTLKDDNTKDGVKQGDTTTEQQASGQEASQGALQAKANDPDKPTEAGKTAQDGGATESGGGAPGGTNLSNANVGQGGAVGVEQQDTNKSLGVDKMVTGEQKGGMTTGAEKSVSSLVPERNPGESDDDYAARVEATRKASADTLVPQPTTASLDRRSDAEKAADASPEQVRAWADQRDPGGARLRAAGVDPNDSAAVAKFYADQGNQTAADRVAAADTSGLTDKQVDAQTLYEEIKDDAAALIAKIDKLGASVHTMAARTAIDNAVASAQTHVASA